MLKLTDEDRLIEAINKHAHGLFDQGYYRSAASLFGRCMQQRPDIPAYTVNYGSALWRLGQLSAAESVLAKAVSRWPKYLDGVENYGKVLVTQGRHLEAEVAFNAIIASDKVYPRAILQRAYSQLQRGEWAQGLEDYEVRREFGKYQTMPMPDWCGEDLSDKTLYVQSEQGLGDTILFSRYLWWIKHKYPSCTIKFCCPPILVNLLWLYQRQGVLTFVHPGIPWEDVKADYGSYLASLPRLHKTRPDRIPLDPGLIEQRCSAQDFPLAEPATGHSLKVGVCWTGNAEMTENKKRSVPVEEFLALADDPRWTLYSLQVGPGRDQLYEQMGQEVIADLANKIGPPDGFVATGACIAKLDLVITVCTSMAHLAAAMGTPTWLLLHDDPYWAWTRRGTTTGWYPSMELFRQQDSSWAGVFDRLRTRLDKRALSA